MYRCSFYCFCWLLAINLSVFISGLGMLGPADLKFKTMKECEPPANIIEFSINQTKFNRSTYVLDITLENPYEIDDNVILELKGSLKKEGGYKPGSFYMKEPVCKSLSLLLGDIFHDILRSAGTEDCPMPAGSHEVKDYIFKNDDFTVPQMYGEYEMIMNMTRYGVVQSCYVMYYDLVPKSMK